MGQNIKREIIDNIVVAMSIYITDQDTLSILDSVVSSELTKVNVQEITSLPAEWKTDTEKRNCYLLELFKIKKRGLSPTTIDGYVRSVKRFADVVGKPLDSVDTFDVEWYLSQYEKRPGTKGEKVQDSTYNNERRFLSAFYTWMRKSKIIDENPVEATEPKKVALKPIDFFSRSEIIQMRDACRTKRERAIIEVFRSTGARVGEIAEIRIDQINTETGDILIKGEKGGRYRTLYLDDDARHYYNEYLESRTDNSPYMFPQSKAPHGKMSVCVSVCGFRTIIKNVGARADVKSAVYPHKMHKTLGMNLKFRRAKMNTVQVTLSVYYKIVGADLYGGPESTGYAMMALDFNTKNLGSVNLPVMAAEGKSGFAETCKVPVENVTLISRQEYEANTAEQEGPDVVVEI